MSDRGNSLSALLLLGLIWGSGYALARFCVTNGISPLGYAFWQALGPAILLCASCQITKRRWSLNKSNLKFFVICGTVGIALPNANMYFSAQHLPAGLLAVLVNTAPMFTLLLAWISGEEKPQALRLAGVASCVIGLLLLTLPSLHWHKNGSGIWLLSTLITPLCFATIATYSSRARPKNLDSLQLASGMLLAASILLTPIVLFTNNFYALNLRAMNLQDAAVLLEILLSALGYILLFKLIAKAGAIYYSLVGGVVACTGLFWGYVLFKEKLNLHMAIAVIAIISGIILCTIKFREQAGQTN